MSTNSTSAPQSATQSATNSNTKSTLEILSDRELQLSRVFDAPRELVWKALTDPTMIAQWWGMRGGITIIDKFDFQPGGAWRFVQNDPDGREHGFRGEYRELLPPERMVQTFEWEGLPGHIVVETLMLEDLGSKTKVVNHSLFASVEDRDGMLGSGMEEGANESWDQLSELLVQMQA